MKQTRKLVNWMVACVVAVSVVASANAQSDKARTGKVVRIKGAARYSTGNNVWQPLKVGDVLKAGSVVQTAADSFVDVVLNDSESAAVRAGGAGAASSTAASQMSYRPSSEQDVVRVLPDTMLGIDRLSSVDTGADKVTETQLDLKSGKIFGTVKKMSAASRFEVKIPNGVAGVRGTVYLISADGVVSVLAGSMVLAYTKPDGSVITQVVTAGWQFDPRTGELTPIPPAVLRRMELWRLEAFYPDFLPPGRHRDRTIHHVSEHGSDDGGTVIIDQIGGQ